MLLRPSWLSEELLETARCCSDRAFYKILLTFLALGGAPGDSSMLLRPYVLPYIINFSGTRRSSWRQLDAAQTVYFYGIVTFPGLEGAP